MVTVLMKSPFFYSRFTWLIVSLLCVIYTILHTVSLQPIVSFSFTTLLMKSAIDALVLIGIGKLLFVAIPSFNYVKLDPAQRFINFLALGLIVILLWTAFYLLSAYLVFGKKSLSEIVTLLPLATFIGILNYLFLVQWVLRLMAQWEKESAENMPDSAERMFADKENYSENDHDNGLSLGSSEQIERVVVRIGQKIHVILINDIIYIRSDGDYVQIITDQGKFIKEETMKYFESGLSSSQFVRIHRSYIVNVEKILRIEMYEKNNQMLTLKNGDKVRASVSGYKALRAVLNL